MSISVKTNPDVPTCICEDPDVDRLRALVAAGHDQFEVSRLIWGDVTPTSLPLMLLATRLRVRAAFKHRFPWLRLPTPTGPEVPHS